MDQAKLTRFIEQCWADEIVPQLVDYIRIPNKSPAFDPDCAAHLRHSRVNPQPDGR